MKFMKYDFRIDTDEVPLHEGASSNFALTGEIHDGAIERPFPEFMAMYGEPAMEQLYREARFRTHKQPCSCTTCDPK